MRGKQQGSAALYFLDLTCMVIAIGLIGFTLYIIPYVVLNYEGYDVPQFVIALDHWFDTHHTLSGSLTAFAIFGPLILASIAFLYIAKLIAFYIETHEPEPGVPHIDLEDYEEHVKNEIGPKRSTWLSTVIVISLMVAVLVTLALLEYFLIINIYN